MGTGGTPPSGEYKGRRQQSKPTTASTSTSATTVPIQSSATTLPQPSSVVSTDISDLSCCYRFWGPFHPILGGHTIEEISTSLYLPTPIVLIYRLTFTIFLITNILYFTITGKYQLINFTVWGLIGLSLSFSLLSACTLTYLLTPASKKYEQHYTPSKIAFLSIITFQIFASSTLFIDVFYWLLLYNPQVNKLDLSNITAHATNFAFVLLEMILSCNMNLKVVYVFFLPCFLIVYLAFMWIRYAVTKDFPYNVFELEGKSVGEIVLYYVGTLVWSFVASFMILLLSKFNRLPCLAFRFYHRRHTQRQFSNPPSRAMRNHSSNTQGVVGVVAANSETANTFTSIAAGDDEGRPFDNMV